MKSVLQAGAALLLVLVVAAGAVAAVPYSGPTPDADGSVASVPDRLAQQQPAEPDIEVEPVALRFPNDSAASTRTLAVRNTGNASLTVTSIVVVGPDRALFTREFSGPVTIAPGESRDVAVTFEDDARQPRFGTLQVMSDDPDEPQVNVWLTNTETVAAVSPSRVLETKTLVNATLEDAEGNTTQSLNVSWPLTRDDAVAVDALSFTPLRDGDIRLSVATNETRFGDVPAFERADGTASAAFVRVEHSIANENVSDVTFTVRVRKDVVAGAETGPEDVALYRYESGTWTELPTRLVGESDTHYFFEALSPGLSDFATGVKQAKFRITDAVVTVTELRTEEGTEVLVRVRNVGGADGTYEVELLLEDAVVERRELSIAPNGTRQATFERSFDRPGTYAVSVNDRFVANVTVESAPATSATGDGAVESGTETTDPAAANGGSSSVAFPGFDAGIAVLAVLLAVVLLLARRR